MKDKSDETHAFTLRDEYHSPTCLPRLFPARGVTPSGSDFLVSQEQSLHLLLGRDDHASYDPFR